jgi:glycosyltransferase involved in cell wall biosynthesis
LFLLGIDARRRGVDVIHGPAYATPLLAPGVATVVTIPDVTWLLHPGAVALRARLMFRLLARVCGRSADRVIAISQSARDELVRHARIDPDKVVVTALAAASPAPMSEGSPSPADVRRSLAVADGARVLLYVGQLAPHKNLTRLVDAVASLENVVLFLAGRHAHGAREVLDHARARSVDVIAPGWVDDVRPLFSIADAFVLPSLAEGFGLSILEAMAAGVPVMCSRAGSLPEVAGDAAALFDPLRTEDIAATCRRLLDDPAARAALVARGGRRVAAFSWQSCARETVETYEAAVRSRALVRRRRGLRRPPPAR